MECKKRTAAFLVLLLFLDFCHTRSMDLPAQLINRYANYSEARNIHKHNGEAKPFVTNAAIRNSSHQSIRHQHNHNESQLENDSVSYQTTTNQFQADNLSNSNSFNHVLRYLQQTLRPPNTTDLPNVNQSTLICENLIESAFHNDVRSVPLALLLTDLVTLLLLIAHKCQQNEAFGRLREIADILADDDTLVEAVQWLVTSLQLSATAGTREQSQPKPDEIEEFARELVRTVTETRQVQQSQSQSELRCTWEASQSLPASYCSEETTLLDIEQGSINTMTFSALLSAQLACEDVGSRCIGVAVYSRQISVNYKLIQSIGNIHCLPENVTSWIKNCSASSVAYRYGVESYNGPHTDHRVKRSTPVQGENGVLAVATIYEHANFKGESKIVAGAIDYLNDDWNDVVSSIACDGECTVIVFENADFDGRQLAIQNRSFLISPLNDMTSSMVVLPYLLDVLCYVLYDEVNFTGQHELFCGDTTLSTTHWPHAIRSVQLKCENCSIILYSERFDGKYKISSEDLADIGSDWLGNVFSIQIRPWVSETAEDEFPPWVILYEHSDYTGKIKRVSGPCPYVGRDMDDQVSSIMCKERCTLIVFEDKEFEGRSQMYRGNLFQLDNFNDILSSLMVFKDEFCMTFYDSSDFRGSSERHCEDVANVPDEWLHKLTSIAVNCDHCSVVVYDQPRFKGRNSSFANGNVSSINRKWLGMVASVQIRPWQTGNQESENESFVVLYTNENYEGHRQIVTGDLNLTGDAFNDQTSSIYFFGSCSFIAFEYANFSGASRLYSGNQSSLGDFNKRLSSGLVLSSQLCVTFYEHSHFQGKSVRYCEDVEYVDSTWNDKFSSLVVDCEDYNCSVLVYEHKNFRGNQRSLRGRVESLGRYWNDRISSLQIRPWKLEVHESCINEEEKKAHNVLQWIPVMSTLYNLATAIYYGAVGCSNVAQERAIDMAIDIGMDAAVALTGGALSAAAYGIKTGTRMGVKVGLKAAMKAASAGLKITAKTGAKTLTPLGLRQLAESSKKAALTQVLGLRKNVKNLPRAVKAHVASVSHIMKQVGRDGFKRTVQKSGAAVKTTAKRKFYGLAENAKRNIDADTSYKKSRADIASEGRPRVDNDKILCRRKRMLPSPVGTSVPDCLQGRKAIATALERSFSTERKTAAQNFFNEVNKLQDSTLVGSSVEFVVSNRPAKVINDDFLKRMKLESPQDVFERLQYYYHYMEKNGEINKYLKVEMKIGGEPITFAIGDAQAKGQIMVIFINKQHAPTVKHTYDYIASLLDGITDPDGGSAEAIALRAKAILEAISATADTQVNWKAMPGVFNEQQREAARELILITHIAECAVPLHKEKALKAAQIIKKKPQSDSGYKVAGGVPGMDKVARGFLRKIEKDPSKYTFTNVFFKANNDKLPYYVISGKDGKKTVKRWLAYNDKTKLELHELNKVMVSVKRRRRNA
jgi:hypothetical protein